MMRFIQCFVLSLLFLAGALLITASANNINNSVFQLTINDAIGPATDDYVEKAIETATLQQTALIVIRMDTPGGLDSAMRSIIKNITNSSVPIVVYVAPTGARAASAGTYILYASHIAAMAPGTNLGAATPVQIGISPSDFQKGKDKEDKSGTDDKDTLQRKIINDAVAYIRGLAQLRNRNQEWAEKAVREAASLPAADALKKNVIDIIATSTADLLKQVDGREVLVKGKKHRLKTAGLSIKEINPDWRSRLLSVITNPNIAYILMLIGIYGLVLEFYNPGAIVPGTIGAICLLLAMYAFQLLPINYAGMGLILLGIALMVAEAFEPSFGMLGIGGVVAFIFGSIILMDTDAPGFGIDISLIATFAVTSVVFLVFVVGIAVKARRRPIVSGMEELLGNEALVIEDFEKKGRVNIHSENWSAFCDTPLHKGQYVKVTGINGLTLQVEPLNESESKRELEQ
ncbi:MAG: nodulation protein NfeD [Gammaproteobacteria bacterium]|nr:nodulation protein NfeD [Gammaproteobacteria bacterium]